MKDLVEYRRVYYAVMFGLITFPSLFGALGVTVEDPEDSPLYSQSMRRTFADMEMRTHASSVRPNRPRTVPGQVILVEGTHWRSASGTELNFPPPLQFAGSGTGTPPNTQPSARPIPRDITTDVSCSFPTMCTTCSATSCGATCDSSPTCRNYPSCHVPGPTCIYYTCGGGTTCDGGATCTGVSCTEPGNTCYIGPTCQVATCTGTTTCDGTPTCTIWATCTGTCVPADCQVALTDIHVPEPGQFQLSFHSSSQLKYALQFCTNLNENVWLEACLTNGSGGVITLRHTNGAPVATYRLLIQTL